jgi:hypothetical protein
MEETTIPLEQITHNNHSKPTPTNSEKLNSSGFRE